MTKLKIPKAIVITIIVASTLTTIITSPIFANVQPLCNPALAPELGGCSPTPLDAPDIIAIILARFFSAALASGTIFFLFYLVINAWRWLAAGGDSGTIAEARQGIINAIIGITILASIFAIANLIAPIIGLSNDNCSFPAQICWPIV